ncbi:MAG: hypothetical protein DCC52_06495 [Chloroflexi bacterium]|nr:MAG: hypothetical protein DCC52_06495 [Chloroflexota bacterium]
MFAPTMMRVNRFFASDVVHRPLRAVSLMNGSGIARRDLAIAPRAYLAISLCQCKMPKIIAHNFFRVITILFKAFSSCA